MRYILYILLVSTLFSCKQTTPKQEKPKYFEGFVEFKATYDVNDQEFGIALQKNFGSRMITYLGQNGFFCREYIDSNNIIIMREVYLPDSLRFYEMVDKSDTILSTDVTRKTPGAEVLGIIKNNPFKILDHSVQAIRAKSVMRGSDGEKVMDIYTTYYNDTLYPIHPLVYKNAAFEGVEEMFSLSPYLTTGIRFQYADKAAFDAKAKRIVAEHVSSFHFDIPKNKTILDF